jgi:hypothetical protein
VEALDLAKTILGTLVFIPRLDDTPGNSATVNYQKAPDDYWNMYDFLLDDELRARLPSVSIAAVAAVNFRVRVHGRLLQGHAEAIVDDFRLDAPGCDTPGIRVVEANPNHWEGSTAVSGTLTLRMWNQTACPGCVDRAVVGIRNSAGAWVGGEPQVIKTDTATTCAPGTTYSGLTFNNLAAPTSAGTCAVWVCLAQAITDREAIDTFKNRVPTTPTETDRLVGMLTVLSQGAVAHFKLNGGARDDGPYENHGVLHGAIPTEDRFGNAGAACYFGGADYIEVRNSPSLRSPSAQVTVAAWVRIDQLYGGVWAPVLCKSANPNNVAGTRQYCFEPYGSGDHVNAVRLGDGIAIATPNPVPLGIWHHWALTYGEGGLVVYIDGTEVTRGPYSGPLPANDDPLLIGRDIPGSVESLVGAVDDVRIYNRALSGEEIRELYRHDGGDPLAAGLVAHYPLDNNARDAGRDGRDGTMHDAGATADRWGSMNGALRFDGIASYVETPFTPIVQPGESITVSAWIRSDTDTSGNPRVVGLERGSDQEPRLLVRSSGVANFFLRDDNNVAATVDSTTRLSDNRWHHVVGVRDAAKSQVRVFVDGVLENEAPDTTSAAVNADQPRWLAIGANNHESGLRELFKGAIDDVRVYNRALAPDEVLALFQMDERIVLGAPVPLPGGLIRFEWGQMDRQAIAKDDLARYTLQASADLRTWSDVAGQPALEDGKIHVATPIDVGGSARFFRVVGQ